VVEQDLQRKAKARLKRVFEKGGWGKGEQGVDEISLHGAA
jgi:hypothetical protein